MLTNIVAFGDLDLTGDYTAYIVSPEAAGRFPVDARELPLSGGWPIVGDVRRRMPAVKATIVVANATETTITALRRALGDGEVHRLVAEDNGGTRYYVNAVCESLQPMQTGNFYDVTKFLATFAIDGSPLWTAETESTQTATVADTTTITIDNGGEETYPIFEYTPNATKTGSYAYQRYVNLAWRGRIGYNMICVTLDTASLIAAGKLRSDLGDLAVIVDGSRVHYTCPNPDDAASHIWFIVNTSNASTFTLAQDILATDVVDTIRVETPIEGIPDTGAILVDDEVFLYDGILDDTFLISARAARGTTAADHTAGATIGYVEHDIKILYGNSSITNSNPYDPFFPTPALDTTSSDNSIWIYDDFGSTQYPMWGEWQHTAALSSTASTACYTASGGTVTSTFDILGAYNNVIGASSAGWYVVLPYSATSAYIEYQVRRDAEDFLVEFRNTASTTLGWNNFYLPPSPASAGVWESGTVTATFDPSLYIKFIAYWYKQAFEVSHVEISFDPDAMPMLALGDEEGAYLAKLTITNDTTSEEIYVELPMALGETLTIDTSTSVIEYDGNRPYSALEVDPTLTKWLTLQPGTNQLTITDPTATDSTITVRWQERVL